MTAPSLVPDFALEATPAVFKIASRMQAGLSSPSVLLAPSFPWKVALSLRKSRLHGFSLHHLSLRKILAPSFASKDPCTIFRLERSLLHLSLRKILTPSLASKVPTPRRRAPVPIGINSGQRSESLKPRAARRNPRARHWTRMRILTRIEAPARAIRRAPSGRAARRTVRCRRRGCRESERGGGGGGRDKPPERERKRGRTAWSSLVGWQGD